jgi:glycosyltransferase involved in cell wall biosynthesis
MRKNKNIYFYILIRSWNAYEYFDKCIDSVLVQNYKNYKILFIDDASNYSFKQKKHIRLKLKKHIVVFNKKRKYALYNAYFMIHKYATNPEAVIFNLDGDDWLYSQYSLSTIARVYIKFPDCNFTYGECFVWNKQKLIKKPSRFILPNVNIRYSKTIVKTQSYRQEPFLPLHPRTWKVLLFNKLSISEFLRPEGNWIRFAEDQAIFFPFLEMAKGKYQVLKKPIYVYNMTNKKSDVNANIYGLLRDEITIRKKLFYRAIQENFTTASINKHSNVAKKFERQCNIYYSGFISGKFPGKILNYFQLIMFKCGLLSTFYLSANNLENANALINSVNKKYDVLYIHNTIFGRGLKILENKKLVLDLLPGFDLNKLTKNELYDLMWTLVFCKYVTEPTKKKLKPIIPSNFPTIRVSSF